jgi:23S rRNA (uridine2552-2'-O)-methyltransferase
VVELGCWPGGWLQVLAQTVGAKGIVVGVDLRAVDPLPGALALQADMTAPETAEVIRGSLHGRPVDAIVSDAAPTLSGIRDIDRAASEERRELRKRFERLTEVRPEGRRSTSHEFYWLGLGHRS